MGLLQYLKGYLKPNPIKEEKRKQENIKKILEIMVKRNVRYINDVPSINTIYDDLIRSGQYINFYDFVIAVSSATDERFIQQIDGGKEQIPQIALHYVITEYGLNHIGMAS